jgi:23S rRNA (uracil1939-C5)-methyltransferase
LNVKFIQGDVLASFTTDFVDSNPKPSIVILDPPRSGTLIEIKKTILYAQPHTIIYVSCNPAALAKDLKMLTTAYSIACIQPIDMFPHSHHIETVVKLVRRKEEDLNN